MAFGNSGMRSGTGVAFTRNPATGAKKLMGEYLINAQGEDVVAGIRTPSPISKLHEEMPEVYDQFVEIATRLENYYKDMQDMEFTIEDGKLFMLQTRNGKRTAQAALKVAVDLVDEGVCTKEQAVMKVEAKQLDALLHPTFDPAALKAATPITTGLPPRSMLLAASVTGVALMPAASSAIVVPVQGAMTSACAICLGPRGSASRRSSSGRWPVASSRRCFQSAARPKRVSSADAA